MFITASHVDGLEVFIWAVVKIEREQDRRDNVFSESFFPLYITKMKNNLSLKKIEIKELHILFVLPAVWIFAKMAAAATSRHHQDI